MKYSLFQDNKFQSVNPFTEEIFSEVPALSDKEWEQKLHLADQIFPSWEAKTLADRTAFIQSLIKILDQKKSELASLITKEMGKPIKQSLAELEKCIKFCEYTATHAPLFLEDKKCLPSAPSNAYVVYKPLGVILGIMPWNFPFWQVFRFTIPTLLCGNNVLVKPAPNVMLCGTQLEKLFIKAGFPLGVYQNLPVSIKQIKQIIVDPRVRGVSLTGSVRAGRKVAALTGQYLKKSVLELGGSDPYVILDSADLKQSAKECVLSRMNNNGQSCIAAKRFIVTDKNAEEFSSLVIELMKMYQMGDPFISQNSLGPLARQDLREQLHNQVNYLVDKGANILLGAQVPKKKGWFYPPTVLSVSASVASSFNEELFGPVALIIRVPNEEEAARVANNSLYGLGSAVFSQEREKAEQWARNRLQAGSCAINQALHSHPALPFGGIKDSGYGRELSDWGFYEFVNVKTIF